MSTLHKCDGQRLTVDVKNYFEVGDTLELISPAGNQCFTLKEILDRSGDAVNQTPGSGHVVSIPLPQGHDLARNGDHALLMRYR